MTISSITRQGAFEPFELQVSRNQIMGHRVVNVFGYNADIDTALETVWPQGGVLTRPAAALAMTVSSSSTDAPTSSGKSTDSPWRMRLRKRCATSPRGSRARWRGERGMGHESRVMKTRSG